MARQADGASGKAQTGDRAVSTSSQHLLHYLHQQQQGQYNRTALRPLVRCTSPNALEGLEATQTHTHPHNLTHNHMGPTRFHPANPPKSPLYRPAALRHASAGPHVVPMPPLEQSPVASAVADRTSPATERPLSPSWSMRGFTGRSKLLSRSASASSSWGSGGGGGGGGAIGTPSSSWEREHKSAGRVKSQSTGSATAGDGPFQADASSPRSSMTSYSGGAGMAAAGSSGTSPLTPPTRTHWQDDAAVDACSDPDCGAPFTLLRRKHHCRHCGGIFCKVHSAAVVRLDPDAHFHSRGREVRACEDCSRAYNEFLVGAGYGLQEAAAATKAGPGLGAGTTTTPLTTSPGVDPTRQEPTRTASTPLAVAPRPAADPSEGPTPSVPHDWTWSTF